MPSMRRVAMLWRWQASSFPTSFGTFLSLLVVVLMNERVESFIPACRSKTCHHSCRSRAYNASLQRFCGLRRLQDKGGDGYRRICWWTLSENIRLSDRGTCFMAVASPVDETLSVRVRLPEWQHMPLSRSLDALEEALTRTPFTDEAWLKSGQMMARVAASLGGNVERFTDNPFLTLKHAAALSLVVRLGERCRGTGGAAVGGKGAPVDLYSSLKYSTKKHGVAQAASAVSQGILPKFQTSRERMLTTRGVEHSLAEIVLVWSTARLLEACAAPEIKRDFVFHLKGLMEHVATRDRVDALLVLCRGLFTPGHNGRASQEYDNVYGATFGSKTGGSSFEELFAEVQRGAANSPSALRAARQAFPFLEIMARWAWRCRLPEAHSDNRFPTNGNADCDGKPPAKPTAGTGFGKSGSGKARQNRGRKIPRPPLPSTVVNEKDNGEGEEAMVIETKANFPHRGREGTHGTAASKEEERGQGNTGIASLLLALGEADPSGDTIRSMQRWATEAVMPEGVRTLPDTVKAHHDIFVQGKKRSRMQWMRSCREVGEVLRLMVGALDEDGPEGEGIASVVNHAMFLTTLLKSMPEGAPGQEVYQQLMSGGSVPEDTKAMGGTRAQLTSWRDAAKGLDQGIASVLKVPVEGIRNEQHQEALSRVINTWRSPQALADYYVMQRREREVAREYLRFLQALLGLSRETVRDIRVKDPSNREHMRHFPARVRELWQAQPCTLGGTADPDVIFRMGEDTRSCMGIRRVCHLQNRALLGYLLQGNVRLVGVLSASGRMKARAIVRLLLRDDNMAPVLFMDSIYYSTKPDAALEEQVIREAQGVSDALEIPLYRAGDTIPVDPLLTDSLEDDDDGWEAWTSHGYGDTGASISSSPELCKLVEVDGLSTWVYSDGAVGEGHSPGLLLRDPYPGSPRKLVVAELRYAHNFDQDFTF